LAAVLNQVRDDADGGLGDGDRADRNPIGL
jgi:hypothetical protein